MKPYQYDYLVFIGRFQPFHIGHKQVIERALELAEKVIVVIGSAYKARDPKNPWTSQERAAMIISEDFGGQLPRIRFTAVRDQIYNNQQWVVSVQEAVHKATLGDGWRADGVRIGIIGHNKDETSFYLDMFPQWDLIEHEMNEEVSATDLRALYFEGKNLKYLETLVPKGTFTFLQLFKTRPEYKTLVDEQEILKDIKKAWEPSPHPPMFVTTDAVVIQSGHILLVERGAAPGRGLLALPGGFLGQEETIEDGMLRELREETRLKVPEPVLRGNIKSFKVFDAPNRSLRGRTITNAYLIELPPGPLPKVKGSDDAKKVMWMPINEVRSEMLFEDHYDIIHYFLGGI